MNIKNFLEIVCNEIKYKPIKQEISQEIESHIKEIKEDYIECGMKEQEAEEKAIEQMGNAEEIGKELNKIHKPKLDWKLLILLIILIGFGTINAILKQSATGNPYISKTIIYILIGFVLGIGIYFFDYRKMKKYSGLIYIFASASMIFSLWEIAIPLYTIAFVGYIVNYNKNKFVELKIDNKQIFAINKDLTKITTLSIISLIIMLLLSTTITNAIILGSIYLVIITVKIIQSKEKCVKRLITIYGGIIMCLTVLLLCLILPNSYSAERLNSSFTYLTERFISSFKPELYPESSRGYTGMIQNEILHNAKLVGEAEKDEISNANIVEESEHFTFIYLIGKIGILPTIMLVIVILLICIKIVTNAKDIKDQYGKYLIIGLGTFYIIQSIANILMNINMGIKTSIILPFVSDADVYYIINILCMAVILSVYRRKDINLYETKSNKERFIKINTVYKEV